MVKIRISNDKVITINNVLKNKKDVVNYIKWLMPGKNINVLYFKFDKNEQIQASVGHSFLYQKYEYDFHFYKNHKSVPKAVIWHEVGHCRCGNFSGKYCEYDASMWAFNTALKRGYLNLAKDMYVIYQGVLYNIINNCSSDEEDLFEYKKICKTIKKKLMLNQK